MIFENPQIDASQLPSVSSVDYRKLSPAFKLTEYIGTAILFTFLLIGATIFFFSVPSGFGGIRYAIYVVWILMFSLSMFMVSKRYEKAGYALREKDVVYKHGVWWQTVTTIPFNRMQHCEISQGPIQNAFGLATLRVFTAGGTSSDLSIDGLAHEEAKRIKDFITGKISGQSEEGSPQSAVHSLQLAGGSDQTVGDSGQFDLEGGQDIGTVGEGGNEPQAPNQKPEATNQS